MTVNMYDYMEFYNWLYGEVEDRIEFHAEAGKLIAETTDDTIGDVTDEVDKEIGEEVAERQRVEADPVDLHKLIDEALVKLGIIGVDKDKAH